MLKFCASGAVFPDGVIVEVCGVTVGSFESVHTPLALQVSTSPSISFKGTVLEFRLMAMRAIHTHLYMLFVSL